MSIKTGKSKVSKAKAQQSEEDYDKNLKEWLRQIDLKKYGKLYEIEKIEPKYNSRDENIVEVELVKKYRKEIIESCPDLFNKKIDKKAESNDFYDFVHKMRGKLDACINIFLITEINLDLLKNAETEKYDYSPHNEKSRNCFRSQGVYNNPILDRITHAVRGILGVLLTITQHHNTLLEWGDEQLVKEADEIITTSRY
jgi:hypothetical protein